MRPTDAIYARKLEPQEIIVRMIQKQPVAIPAPQAREMRAQPPILFNDAVGGDDLIAKWAKWRKPRPKTVYETRRIMRKLTNFFGFDDLTGLSKADVERWLEHLDDSGAAPVPQRRLGGRLRATVGTGVAASLGEAAFPPSRQSAIPHPRSIKPRRLNR